MKYSFYSIYIYIYTYTYLYNNNNNNNNNGLFTVYPLQNGSSPVKLSTLKYITIYLSENYEIKRMLIRLHCKLELFTIFKIFFYTMTKRSIIVNIPDFYRKLVKSSCS